MLKPVKRNKLSIFELANSNNPLLEQISDSKELTNLMTSLKLVPFAGSDKYTGHTLLKFLLNMRTLSTTHGSCIKTLKGYCFPTKIDIVHETNTVFETSNTLSEVDSGTKTAFADFLSTIKIDLGDFRKLALQIFDDRKTTGNAYVSLTLSDTVGVKGYSITHYSPDKCMYYYTEKGEQKIIAVSSKWDENYLINNPPKLIPLYPNYTTDENGSLVTIFHLKTSNKWYDLPDSFESFYAQYLEFRTTNYLINQNDTGFTGKILLEFEAGNPEHDSIAGDENKDTNDFNRWETNFTNAGESPSSLMLFERPYGAKEVKVHEFTPNTNEKYFKAIKEIAKNEIVQSHSLTLRMLGEAAPSGLANNAAMDDFKQRLPIIKSYQTEIATFLNTIINEVLKFAGITDFDHVGIGFTSPYEVMLNDIAAQNPVQP